LVVAGYLGSLGSIGMLAKIATIAGLFASAICLAISLMMLPATLTLSVWEWLAPLTRGQYRLMIFAAFISAIPFGLAFGAIPDRGVILKSVAASIGAALLILLFVGASEGIYTKFARAVMLECGLFVALFSAFAVVSYRLSRGLPRRPRVVAGTAAFVTLFALLTVLPFYNAIPKTPITPEARLERALQQVRYAKSDLAKFYALNDAAKQSFVLGHIDDARQYANELLRIAEQWRGDWNYGNALHDGNLVLGRIAVREGRIEDAKQFLLKAGATPGSPQLDSFGPNMSLAKDLLDQGERSVVLDYFELCRKFWESNHGKLNEWTEDIRSGKAPDFGANLVY
jgi:hypothetical protein